MNAVAIGVPDDHEVPRRIRGDETAATAFQGLV
jgi:hypothetical protein